MYKKKGQVTIFIVLGLVLLLSLGIGYYLVSAGKLQEFTEDVTESSTLIDGKTAVQAYTESCLDAVTKQGIIVLGASGGVIYPDEETSFLATEQTMVTYLLRDPNERKEKMENDLELYVMKNIDVCLDNFSSFSFSVTAKSEQIEAQANIRENSIELYLYYPLTITFESEIGTIEEFFATPQSRLQDMTSVAERLIEKSESGTIDLTHDTYQITAYPFDEKTMIFAITDQKNLIDGTPLLLFFAARVMPEYAPVLEYIPDLTLRQGQTLVYYLKAIDQNNDHLVYSSDEKDVVVTEDGTLTLEATNAGTYDVTFTVQDEIGLEDSQQVKITVIAPYE